MFGKTGPDSVSRDRLAATRRRRHKPKADATLPGTGGRVALRARERDPAPAGMEEIRICVGTMVAKRIGPATVLSLPRGELAERVTAIVDDFLTRENLAVQPLEHRGLVSALINDLNEEARKPRPKEAPSESAPKADGAKPKKRHSEPGAEAPATARPAPAAPTGRSSNRAKVEEAALHLQPILMDRIDVSAASELPRNEIAQQITEIVGEIAAEEKLQLNQIEQRDLVTKLLNDMLGLGPIEPLLADDSVTDIMVNGPKLVYVERGGKLELSDIRFRDDAHVMNVAGRIVSSIGRRIDESSPLCDARLADGSRVNIIIPPLAIDGPSISIRKFAKKGITLDVMERQGNLSPQMAIVLKIAARSRLNILISGGTGSGKTTLLNALSQMIENSERIVTIEDAAELQLQQTHVVRLETRPPNLEGQGEITMRDLVKNSLRMRPDRIILGEVRGSEAVDMLQAMNTGHEGSLGTVHANRPREALTRIENMVGMAGINLPAKAVRTQIAAALDMIVQVARMRDGVRRVTNIMEIVGMEGDVVTTQELFAYKYEGEGTDGILRGTFESTGLRPHFTPKAEYFGLDRALLEAV